MNHLPLSTVIVQIVQHTPGWVWGILAAITLLGLHQMRDHEMPRVRLLLAAVGLGAYSLWGATAVFGIDAAAAWLAGLALALAVNQKLQWPRDVAVLGDGRFALKGSSRVSLRRYLVLSEVVAPPTMLVGARNTWTPSGVSQNHGSFSYVSNAGCLTSVPSGFVIFQFFLEIFTGSGAPPGAALSCRSCVEPT